MGSKMLKTALICLFLASINCAWNYNNPDVDWPTVNAACTVTGTSKQSPINIQRWTASINTSSLTLSADYSAKSELGIKNAGGHTQKVEAKTDKPFGTIKYDGKTYNFLQFHFHQPSEHTISGLRFDMEMHLVHQVSTGAAEYLVLGYLFNIGGSDNEWLNEIMWKSASATTDAKVTIPGSVQPWDMIKKMNDMDAFLYEGSFTTPPCTEGVHWFVWRDFNYMSKVQWDYYKTTQPTVAMVYGTGNGSYRPVQALNSRTVTLRTIHIDNGDYLSAGTIAGIVIGCVIGIVLLIGIPAICWWCNVHRRKAQEAQDLADHIEEQSKNDNAGYQPVQKVD